MEESAAGWRWRGTEGRSAWDGDRNEDRGRYSEHGKTEAAAGRGGGSGRGLNSLFSDSKRPVSLTAHRSISPPTGTPLRTPRHRRDPMIPASEPPFPDPGHRHRPKPTELTTLFPDRAMLLPHERVGRLFRAGTCGVEIQFRRTRSWSGWRVAGKAASRGARRGRRNRASTPWACADSPRLSAG